MNLGDSVLDASRSGPDEGAGRGDAVADRPQTRAEKPGTAKRSTEKPVEDIQDLVDKLAAVTKQLNRPGRSLTGSSR